MNGTWIKHRETLLFFVPHKEINLPERISMSGSHNSKRAERAQRVRHVLAPFKPFSSIWRLITRFFLQTLETMKTAGQYNNSLG